jgi:tetratricopeptide (TPR) repeat protein
MVAPSSLSRVLLLTSLATLAAQPASAAAPPADPACALALRARQLARRHKLAEAEQSYLAALRWLDRRAGRYPSEATCALAPCRYRNHLAELQVTMMKFTQARELLRATVASLHSLAARSWREPALRLELARAHRILGNCYRDSALPRQAAASEEKAIQILEKLVTEYPDGTQQRRDLVQALSKYGLGLMALARYQDAERALERALGLARKLAADAPKSPEEVELLTRACNDYAYLVREWGRYGRSVEILREIVERFEQLKVAYPDQPDYWRRLPAAYRNLAQPLSYLQDQAGERAALHAADRLERELARHPHAGEPLVTDEDRLLGSLSLKNFDRLAGQQEEADRVYRQAKRLVRQHPEVPGYRVGLARARILMALRLLSAGSRAEVGPPLRAALADLARLAAKFPDVPRHRRALGECTVHAGTIYLLAGHRAEGERCVRTGIEVLRKLADDYPQVPGFRYTQGLALARVLIMKESQGQRAEALSFEVAGLKILDRLAKEFPACPIYRRQSAQGHVTLGMHLVGQDDDRAEAEFRTGVRMWAVAVSDFPAEQDFRQVWGNAWSTLGHFLTDRQKPAEAESAFAQAICIHRPLAEKFPQDSSVHFVLATDYVWQARLHENQKRLPAARSSYAASIASLERAVQLQPRRDWLLNLQLVLRQRALLCQALDNGDEYRRDLQKSEEVGERLSPALVRLSRAAERARIGETVRALQDAADLFLDDLPGDQWYDLAVLYATLSRSAKDVQGRQKAAARAVVALGRALERGHVNPVPPAEDPAFRALAGRADFKKLVGGGRK